MRRTVLRHARTWIPSLPGQLVLAFLLLDLSACGASPSGTDEGDDAPGEQTLTVLYTVDERGRLGQDPSTDGPAKLMGVWRSAENFDARGDFLILSGGNSWLGPAISSWFEGASTVEVMNRMSYDGEAIGSQEFQFGVDALRERVAEADYAFLSSNVLLRSSGSHADFAAPFTVVNVNGLRVGLVGLTPTSTPDANLPANVEGLDFGPYTNALNESVPQAEAAGANIVLVLAHLCYSEMLDILPTARGLGVAMIGGAFCDNKTVSEVRDGVALVAPQPYFAGYAKVSIRTRSDDHRILDLQTQLLANSGGSADPEVEAVVQKWEAATEQELSEVIGYVNSPVMDGSPALNNLVMDSWLHAYPADIAMLNSGAIRQGLPQGDITRGAVVNAMPFENNLVELELTGAQVIDCLQSSTILGGMTTIGGYFHADGTPLKADSVYHVLTTDFLYSSADYDYSLYDSDPTATGIVYRQPTLTYLAALGTTEGNPLDPFLDTEPRR